MPSLTSVFVGLFAIGNALAFQHSHHPKRHTHHNLHKKGIPTYGKGVCQFPEGEGIISVTPDAMNAGWAMSPDQPCEPGMYCPYACPPGQLMAQWNPKAKSYSYPESMDGGLYCNENGEIEKPFPKKPYCYDGVGTLKCKNKAKDNVAFCQTVLPGNEAMLIPTDVENDAILAVPDTSYWVGTAAHYYINPPGVSIKEACVWGTKDKPIGNWSPYVAGANAAEDGETFVKLGWNPIYIEPDVAFRDEVPNWGVRVECDGPCSGLPCEIDPSKHGVNEISQNNPPGAGGATFCVVGVPVGSTATIEVFMKDGSDAGDIEIERPRGKRPQESALKEEIPKKKEISNDSESAEGDDEIIEEVSSSSYVAPVTSSRSMAFTSSSTTDSFSTSSTLSSSTSSSSFLPSLVSHTANFMYPLETKVPHTTLIKTSIKDAAASTTGTGLYPVVTSNGTTSMNLEAPATEEPSRSSAAGNPLVFSISGLFLTAFVMMSL